MANKSLIAKFIECCVVCVCVGGGGGRCVRSVTDVQQDVFFVHKKPTVQLLWGEQVV